MPAAKRWPSRSSRGIPLFKGRAHKHLLNGSEAGFFPSPLIPTHCGACLGALPSLPSLPGSASAGGRARHGRTQAGACSGWPRGAPTEGRHLTAKKGRGITAALCPTEVHPPLSPGCAPFLFFRVCPTSVPRGAPTKRAAPHCGWAPLCRHLPSPGVPQSLCRRSFCLPDGRWGATPPFPAGGSGRISSETGWAEYTSSEVLTLVLKSTAQAGDRLGTGCRQAGKQAVRMAHRRRHGPPLSLPALSLSAMSLLLLLAPALGASGMAPVTGASSGRLRCALFPAGLVLEGIPLGSTACHLSLCAPRG